MLRLFDFVRLRASLADTGCDVTCTTADDVIALVTMETTGALTSCLTGTESDVTTEAEEALAATVVGATEEGVEAGLLATTGEGVLTGVVRGVETLKVVEEAGVLGVAGEAFGGDSGCGGGGGGGAGAAAVRKQSIIYLNILITDLD